MKILGIDPGIERLGWGIVEAEGSHYYYRRAGCIRSSKDKTQQERLESITRDLEELIREEKPEKAAIEKLFFAKNKKTALIVSEARGAILLTLSRLGIPTHEFTPLEVKLAITGNGRAEKHQVEWMVKRLLGIKEHIASDDAYDALALCLMVRPS
jgi:crossover junction endodeoxyribonuclease RuvC